MKPIGEQKFQVTEKQVTNNVAATGISLIISKKLSL
jgi:hypothetical protein